jgi:chromosome partitioning protein
MYDVRTNLNQGVLDAIRKQFGNMVTKTVIRRNVTIADACGVGQSVIHYSPTSYGAEDYLDFAKEVINRD